MRGRLGFIVLVIFGSFCVYCAQNVVGGSGGSNGNGGNDGSGGGGMVGNAGADTCCTPPDPPPGDVLFDQKFTPTLVSNQCVSPGIDVAGHRTIVVHGNLDGVQWSFGGAVGWVWQSSVTPSALVVLDGRLGKQLRIGFAATCASNGVCECPTDPTPLTVVGYKQ
jgi:hypothetical protein